MGVGFSSLYMEVRYIKVWVHFYTYLWIASEEKLLQINIDFQPFHQEWDYLIQIHWSDLDLNQLRRNLNFPRHIFPKHWLNWVQHFVELVESKVAIKLWILHIWNEKCIKIKEKSLVYHFLKTPRLRYIRFMLDEMT